MGLVDAGFEQTTGSSSRGSPRPWSAPLGCDRPLWPTPESRGNATPAFGEDAECVRIAGTFVVRESEGVATYARSGVQPPSPYELRRRRHRLSLRMRQRRTRSGGSDQPLDVSEIHVLDDLPVVQPRLAGVGTPSSAVFSRPAVRHRFSSVAEHFDIGTDIDLADDQRVNLGCSPGDGYESDRICMSVPGVRIAPGDPDYWHGPFGALLHRRNLRLTVTRSRLVGRSSSLASRTLSRRCLPSEPACRIRRRRLCRRRTRRSGMPSPGSSQGRHAIDSWGMPKTACEREPNGFTFNSVLNAVTWVVVTTLPGSTPPRDWNVALTRHHALCRARVRSGPVLIPTNLFSCQPEGS